MVTWAGGRARAGAALVRRMGRTGLLALLVAWLGLAAGARPAAAKELRRSMLFLRPALMGGAYVAVGDEASTVFFNPAGIARVPEGSVDVLTPQVTLNDLLKRVLVNPEDVQAEYSNLTLDQLKQKIGTSLFADVNMLAPMISSPQNGLAFGLGVEALGSVEVIQKGELAEVPLPALHVEYFSDAVLLLSLSTQIGENLWVGMTPKLIHRIGLDKTIDAATLFAAGPTLDLSNDPDFKAAATGTAYDVPGLDVGMIYQFPFGGDWQPRIGYSILNIGDYSGTRGWTGMEFGERRGSDQSPVAGTLPLLHTIGFALSPTFHAIRYTFALDVVDVTRQALPGDSWGARTRVGFEVGVGPHTDGTALFSLLFGWNAEHFGWGALSRVWIFEVGMGNYTVERGEKPGDNPDRRQVLLLGFHF